MRHWFYLLASLALIGLGACNTAPGEYPITGAPCGPDDAVKDLGGTACASPTGAGVGVF